MAEEQNNSFIHQTGEMIGNAIQALGNQLDKIFSGLRGMERGNGLDLKLSFSSQGNSLKQRSATGSHENPPKPIPPRQRDPNVFPQKAQEPDKGLAAEIAKANREKYGPSEFNSFEAGYGGKLVSPSPVPGKAEPRLGVGMVPPSRF